ncbi:hypothetical protein [Weissella confusa]|nr:hypothetical protein [Weissella confusa]
MTRIDTPILNAVRKVIDVKHISVRDMLCSYARFTDRFFSAL